ncbi:MAG: hypothetical protein VXZ15_07995 [Planctomycetota bacterium]|nr:hypothetical protein [Planctomycetota bacterium]
MKVDEWLRFIATQKTQIQDHDNRHGNGKYRLSDESHPSRFDEKLVRPDGSKQSHHPNWRQLDLARETEHPAEDDENVVHTFCSKKDPTDADKYVNA